MTFDELKEQDVFKAFNSFITVKDAKASGLIPEAYHSIFKDTCKCGSDFIIKDNLSTVQCCNPRCYIKLGYMLAETLARFGCKGIGEATCIDLVVAKYDKLKYKSHVELLVLKEDELPDWMNNMRGFNYLQAINSIKSANYTVNDICSNLAIPAFNSTIKKLLDPYNSVDEFLADIKKSGGIAVYLLEQGINDRQKAFYLREFLPDLMLAQLYFSKNIRLKGLKVVDICITGFLSPEGRVVKQKEFIEILNEAGKTVNGLQLMEFNETDAISSVPYIVADSPSTSRKYRKGVERGVLITSSELLNEVRKVVAEYNEEYAKQHG